MPLSHLRVIELSAGVASAFAGRMLADLGAEVILLGAPRRNEPKPDGDVLATSLWQALHRNKRHGGALPNMLARWQEVLEWCDVLLVEGDARDIAALQLPDPLPRHVVAVAISHFGQSGTRASWRGSDLVDAAYGGGCNKNGEPARPPLRPPAYVGDHEVGLNAAIAALIAWRAAQRDGVGQWVDVSAVDTWATVQTGVGLLEFVFLGRLEVRLGRSFAGRGYPYTMLPCKDGHVRLICLQGREWARAIQMMGNPEWARNPRYANRVVNQERYSDELDALVGAWLSERTMSEVLTLALEHNVPWAPVQTLSDVLKDTQLEARDFWWNAGGIRLPGFPAKFSRTPAAFRMAAPRIDSASSPLAFPSPGDRTGQMAKADHALPAMSGIRVLDLGWAWAGAVPGAVLADFGADVVKIESSTRLDPMRMDRPLIGEVADREQGSLHHNINRNKRSIEVDLQQPEGPETIRRLAAVSDILIENLSTGSLARFGLDYERLSAINPRLIYVSIGGVGRTGPLRHLRSYAPVLTGISGMDSAVGYEGESMLGLQHGFADPNAGLHAAFVIMAALHERERSGKGQYIDVSQLEATVSLLGGQLVALQKGADFGNPMGNRDPLMAPHGVYPAAGVDQWIAIACEDDRAWASFVEVLGKPAWACDPDLATTHGRLARQQELDRAIAQWSAELDRWEMARMLQEVGIAAAPLLTSEDRVADEHLASREAFVVVDHPVVGAEFIYGVPWKMSRTPGAVRSGAPLLGEHTAAVMREYLGEGTVAPVN